MLSDRAIKNLEQRFNTIMEVVFFTGEVVTKFTKFSLNGSYDSRVSLQLRDYVWKTEEIEIQGERKKVPVKVDCRPYLRVECSLHKFILGHNCFSGSDDLLSQVAFLLKRIESAFDVSLPPSLYWKVLRLDYARTYNMGSFEAVSQYIRGLFTSEFPRRKVHRFAETGLYVPGTTTTLKFYHKGPEFYKHDFKRIKKFKGDSEAFQILEKANRILRVECEFKQKKLEQIFGCNTKIKDISIADLVPYYDVEVQKLLKEAKGNEIVRTSEDVLKRLNREYGVNLGNTLFSSWVILSTMGEMNLKKSLTKATFYRHRKLLQDAGVSWNNTDITRQESIIPFDFVPVSTSKYCLHDVHPIFQKIAI